MTKELQNQKEVKHDFKTRAEYLKSNLARKDFFGNKKLTFEEFKRIKTIMFCGECGRPLGIDEKLYITEARESSYICKDCVDKKNKQIVNSCDMYRYKNEKDLYNDYLRFTCRIQEAN